MKDLQGFYNQVIAWNMKSGQRFQEYGTAEWDKALSLQSKLLVEEATETKDAMEYNDYVELLDGAVDTLVILSYMFAQLEAAGFDVEGALQAVIYNNDTKVFNSYYEAVDAKEKLEERDDKEYYVETAVHNGLPFYTLRREDGKIIKPVDFVAVELSEFVP